MIYYVWMIYFFTDHIHKIKGHGVTDTLKVYDQRYDIMKASCITLDHLLLYQNFHFYTCKQFTMRTSHMCALYTIQGSCFPLSDAFISPITQALQSCSCCRTHGQHVKVNGDVLSCTWRLWNAERHLLMGLGYGWQRCRLQRNMLPQTWPEKFAQQNLQTRSWRIPTPNPIRIAQLWRPGDWGLVFSPYGDLVKKHNYLALLSRDWLPLCVGFPVLPLVWKLKSNLLFEGGANASIACCIFWKVKCNNHWSISKGSQAGSRPLRQLFRLFSLRVICTDFCVDAFNMCRCIWAYLLGIYLFPQAGPPQSLGF